MKISLVLTLVNQKKLNRLYVPKIGKYTIKHGKKTFFAYNVVAALPLLKAQLCLFQHCCEVYTSIRVVLQKLPQLSETHFSQVLNKLEKNFFIVL